ncbi:unnamed protein product [Rotaria sordida]|uniref:Reverse transcriptase domain-containing protein n=1 Tax=Rotaria sordida TaxID=392033 RepID=A0A815EM54_9BILA|nr:unnamed protein product [Rotaria sordida]CAF1311832.1 unnamed protein product [Rotaria sordida]
MTDDTHNHEILHSMRLAPDVQVILLRMLSSTEELTGSTLNIIKKTSRHHGNVKLQRFKRKWRKRGLNEDQINELINERNASHVTEDTTNLITDNENNHNKKVSKINTSITSNKRKRFNVSNRNRRDMMKSLSQITISRPSKKKRKDGDKFTNNNDQRLTLLDRLFSLTQDMKLYESYLNEARQYRIWPEDIIDVVPINEHESIEKWFQTKLVVLQQNLNQCSTELLSQSLSCPKSFSIQYVDNRLQEFVHDVREKQLHTNLYSYSLIDDHKQFIQSLINLRRKQLQVLEEMTMFEVRILCKHLPKSINQLNKMIPLDNNITTHDVSIQNRTLSQQELSKKYRKEIQNLKRSILHETLKKYENMIEEDEHLYQKELFLFEHQLSQHTNDVNNLIICLNTYLNHYTNKMIQQIRYRETIFRMKLYHPRHHRKSASTSSNQNISVHPEIILDIPENIFTDEELTLLSSAGGPSYIRYNQSYLYRRKKNQIYTEKELEGIINNVVSDLRDRYHIPTKALEIQNFTKQLKSLFNERYEDSLSYRDKYRIRREIKLIHSIRRKLHQRNHIIRVTDKSGVFHVGSMLDYERKVEEYQLKTNAYIELSSNPLMETYDKVLRLLNDLRVKKQITQWQYSQMLPDKNKIKLAYLYFIPKPHKEGTPLRPIISGIYAPTAKISKMLDKLIRPLFDEYAQPTIIIDGVHLIHRLHKYVSLGLLKPTTLLCTFDITDLYTMLPQEEAIAILKQFLLEFGHRHVKNMSIDAIQSLARIVLSENVFTYNNKYFRQIKGGAMGSPFTLTLANIFMWYWEKKLVNKQKESNELYGRYIDDIFLTTNDSIEQVQQMLNEADNYHPDIKLIYEISNSVSFLDLQIENVNGQLQTSVHHKHSAEPYLLPFKSDHPHHLFGNNITTALLRTIRYCSTLEAFNREQRYIKTMLLYAGYDFYQYK